MLFFPPTDLNGHGLDRQQALLIKILLFSLLAHMFLVIILFLGHFFSRQSLVLSGGAKVSMRSSRGQGMGGSAQSQSSNEQAKQVEPPQTAPEQSSKNVQEDALTKPSPKEEIKNLPLTKEQKKEKKNEAVPAKKKAESKEQQKVPAFSELKKKYTSLKKVKEEVPQKQVPKEKEKLDEKPVAKEPVKESQLNKSPVKQTLNKQTESHAQTEQKLPQGLPRTGLPGTGFPGNSSGNAEQLEFDINEIRGSESSIVQEIEAHYRRPPGFDDHEPFVFTFEIRNGKAVTIGAKGSEPLVIYSAVKEAVLKSAFAVLKQDKKIELLIKSHA